jgi:CRP-like cAMP-binding protein
MTQTLSLIETCPPTGSSAALHKVAYAVPYDEVITACDLFFARTAAAGKTGNDDHLAVSEAIVGFVAADSGRPIPPTSSSNVHLIVEGCAYRARTLANGSRQISDILLPGDVFSWTTSSLETDYDIRVCGFTRVALLRRDVVTGRDLPSLRHRWEWVQESEARRLRSRLVSQGCRDARARVAHLVAELHDRLQQVGLADAGAFICPLIQEQFGDALGLTSVHVNRMFQSLRQAGLVVYDGRRVVIPSLARLHETADFAEGSLATKPRRLM